MRYKSLDNWRGVACLGVLAYRTSESPGMCGDNAIYSPGKRVPAPCVHSYKRRNVRELWQTFCPNVVVSQPLSSGREFQRVWPRDGHQDEMNSSRKVSSR
jgi:hypothetical protein